MFGPLSLNLTRITAGCVRDPGYAHLKESGFPHKRTKLGMLLRERFFEEWLRVPRDAVAATYSTSLS
jgi:hypothetical protein